MTTAGADSSPKPVEVFCSYAHEDEAFREELVNHLALLRRRRVINLWHDRAIVPGTDWSVEILTQLRRADLILLLVSSDFMASDFVFDIELKEALERHEKGQARAIPIIIRATDFEDSPFAKLQALPKDAKPVKAWADRDEAWVDVVKGIRSAIKVLHESPLRTTRAAAAVDQAVEAQELDALTKIRADFSKSIERSMASRDLAKPNEAQMGRLLDCLIEINVQRKILWVDDNPMNNATETAALRRLQIEVVTVTDTEQAIDLLKRDNFDLVLSDWERLPAHVPGLSEGQRLLRVMREQKIAVPVVFYYGAYDHEAKQATLLAEGARGATYRTDELYSLISAVLLPSS